jgi:hypothetical protein
MKPRIAMSEASVMPTVAKAFPTVVRWMQAVRTGSSAGKARGWSCSAFSRACSLPPRRMVPGAVAREAAHLRVGSPW